MIKLWVSSSVISLLLLVSLVYQWYRMNQYEVVPSQQLTSMADVDNYLNTAHADLMKDDNVRLIVTGIYIQSLKFFNSSEVNLTGYIWQHFPKSVYAGVADEDIKPEFILPEQVNSGSDISPVLTYRHDSIYGEVLGWYFEATLKQSFDYTHYPFDHKTVWIQLWARDFSGNVILMPDLQSYKNTDLTSIFGIEDQIVLGAWIGENTYFDYRESTYDTNFGIPHYIGQEGFPELYYNFVVKRRFDDAFIVYLLPLFLVSILLFAALLTVSESRKSSDLIGFNISGFLGMCSALFFVVLIAHIQLREQFAGARVVYLEYYYILMYAMLVFCTVNAYLFVIRPKAVRKCIVYGDNVVPKIAYWPLIFTVLNVLTLFFI